MYYAYWFYDHHCETHNVWFENEIIVNRSHLNWWIAGRSSPPASLSLSLVLNHPFLIVSFASTWWHVCDGLFQFLHNRWRRTWYLRSDISCPFLLLLDFFTLIFLAWYWRFFLLHSDYSIWYETFWNNVHLFKPGSINIVDIFRVVPCVQNIKCCTQLWFVNVECDECDVWELKE